MHPLNVFDFYSLGAEIRSLKNYNANTAYKDCFADLFGVRFALEALVSRSVGLKVCEPAARAIIAAIDSDVPKDFYEAHTKYKGEESNKPLASYWRIESAVAEFETVLAAECRMLDIYAVAEKGIYSTSSLVANGENAIPSSVRDDMLPRALRDFNQAARCLAFELPNACGFHAVRAAESQIHQYYVTVTGDANMRRKDRNWGAYVRNLNRHKRLNADSKADPKIISLVDQVREHHRNVVIHPEENLDLDEALSLFSMVQSVVISVVKATKAISAPPLTLKSLGGLGA